MRDLSRLLRPKSIAVVGGGAWCDQIILQCQKMGFAGQLWMVHPKEIEVRGVKAVVSLDRLPSPPDAVFVGVNRHLTIELVRALSAMRAGGAVCFASGFSEAVAEDAAASDLQSAMRLIMRCFGQISTVARLWTRVSRS